MAIEIDLVAFKHAAWGGDTGGGDLPIFGVDWSAAVFLWQFGSPDSAVISLGNAPAGSEGVSASYNPEHVDPLSGAAGPATLIRPQINEGTMEALTYSGSADLELDHVLYVTPAGGLRQVIAFGKFTVRQGVADV